MSRVSDDDLRRLSSALSTPAAARTIVQRDDAGARRAMVEGLQAELGRKAGDEGLGRALTQSIATYLNRPVRVVAGGASAVLAGAWRYVAKSEDAHWWIEIEAPLGASLADAMLGGAGVSSKSGAGRRARALVARVADLFFETMSSVVEAPRPSAATSTDAGITSGEAQIAGRCAVTGEAFAWQAGIVLAGNAGVAETIAPPRPPPEEIAAPRYDALPLVTREPVAVSSISDTIVAACAGLFEVLGCPVTVSQPAVTQLDAPEVPRAALRLALTTGGKGALVVCAQRNAVIAFASGASGGRIPESDQIGTVVCAAAEAVLREVIQGIAARLTAISGAPQRTVHIAGDAQLARTQHLSADVSLQVAANAANLNVLVPRWMAGPS